MKTKLQTELTRRSKMIGIGIFLKALMLLIRKQSRPTYLVKKVENNMAKHFAITQELLISNLNAPDSIYKIAERIKRDIIYVHNTHSN